MVDKAFDFKKEYKDLYVPKNKPVIMSDPRKSKPESMKTVLRLPLITST